MLRPFPRNLLMIASLTTVTLSAAGCPDTDDVRTTSGSPAPTDQVARMRDSVSADLDFLVGLTGRATSSLFRTAFERDFSGTGVVSWIGARVSTLVWDDTNTRLPVEHRPVVRDGRIVGTRTIGSPAGNMSATGPDYWGVFLIGPMYFAQDMDRASRLSIIVHEARHSDGFRVDYMASVADGAGHPHAICPSNFDYAPFRGHDACDSSLQGSYSYMAIFARELVMNCSNCSELVRSSAAEKFVDATLRHTRSADRAALGVRVERR